MWVLCVSYLGCFFFFSDVVKNFVIYFAFEFPPRVLSLWFGVLQGISTSRCRLTVYPLISGSNLTFNFRELSNRWWKLLIFNSSIVCLLGTLQLVLDLWVFSSPCVRAKKTHVVKFYSWTIIFTFQMLKYLLNACDVHIVQIQKVKENILGRMYLKWLVSGFKGPLCNDFQNNH